MENISFFGLGNMGLPVALNLVKAGYQVKTAIHRNDKGPKALEQAGGIIAANVAEAVRDADILFTIVPDSKDLCDLMLKQEMMAAVPEGCILVDMTSCSAEAICQVERAYRSKGVKVIDAPLSGGVTAAENGTMTMMCCGDEAAYQAIRPVLDVIGGKFFFLGKLGNGKKIKALNNLLAAIHQSALGEAIKIMRKNEIDPELFYEVVSQSSGASMQLEMNFKKIVEGRFTPPAFTVKLMRKDVELALALSDSTLYTPVAEMVRKVLYQAAIYDEEDCVAVAKLSGR